MFNYSLVALVALQHCYTPVIHIAVPSYGLGDMLSLLVLCEFFS